MVPHTPAAYFAPNPRVGEGTMRTDSTADTDQIASVYAPERFIPRDKLPEWVFETRTRFLVAAPTAERAHQWFVDESDIEVDTEIIDFGQVDPSARRCAASRNNPSRGSVSPRPAVAASPSHCSS